MSAHDAQSLTGHDPAKSWVARLIAWSVRNQLIVAMLAADLFYTTPGHLRSTSSIEPLWMYTSCCRARC